MCFPVKTKQTLVGAFKLQKSHKQYQNQLFRGNERSEDWVGKPTASARACFAYRAIHF